MGSASTPHLLDNAPDHQDADAFEWTIDSGANEHICCHFHDFSTFKPLDPPLKTKGVGGWCTITGIGTVRISLANGTVLKLKRVLFAPNAECNLISVSRLVEAYAMTFTFSRGACWTVPDPSSCPHLLPALQIRGTLSPHGLYYLEKPWKVIRPASLSPGIRRYTFYTKKEWLALPQGTSVTDHGRSFHLPRISTLADQNPGHHIAALVCLALNDEAYKCGRGWYEDASSSTIVQISFQPIHHTAADKAIWDSMQPWQRLLRRFKCPTSDSKLGKLPICIASSGFASQQKAETVIGLGNVVLPKSAGKNLERHMLVRWVNGQVWLGWSRPAQQSQAWLKETKMTGWTELHQFVLRQEA